MARMAVIGWIVVWGVIALVVLARSQTHEKAPTCASYVEGGKTQQVCIPAP